MRCFEIGSLRIHAFGGWREIGGNQLLLEARREAILLDFGRSFARWNAYFTEFLPPGALSACGICSPWIFFPA